MAAYLLQTTKHAFMRWFVTNKLRNGFIVGLVFAFLVAIGNIVVVKSLLHKSDMVADTVNVAGKMRMLGQRIGLMQMSILYLSGTNSDFAEISKANFQDYKNNFEDAFNALQNGGEAFGLHVPPVTGQAQNILTAINTAWVNYLQALEASNNRLSDGSVVELITSGEALLSSSELLINSMVHQFKAMQADVVRKIYVLFAINLLILIFAGLVIFHKVLRPIQSLMNLSKELSLGNYSARLRLSSNDEFARLSNVLNESAQHIEQLLYNVDLKQKSLEQAEIKLRRSALVFEHVSEAVVITDANGYVQDVNRAFSSITGYSSNEVIGQRLNKLSSGKNTTKFYEMLWHGLINSGKWKGDILNKRKSGDEFTSHLRINTYFNDDGSVNCRIGLFSDVTEKRAQEALIWRQSRFDHLTQLPNRQMMHENLHLSISQSKRSNLPFALIFLDLDLFKEVNDTFGHSEGDLLLQEVARRLSACCRRSDQVARLGGDEFVVIIQDLKQVSDISPICKKILDCVAKPYQLSVSNVQISCSMGVTFYPQDADTPERLLQYADIAMYAAKEKGRNQYCVFSPHMYDAIMQNNKMLHDLQGALDSQQFILHYQPIVNLRTGDVHKAEALVRWQHPELGLISPAEFIPLAEDSGMIVSLGRSIFAQAAQQVAVWRNNLHKNFAVNINVSPAQFRLNGIDPKLWISTLKNLELDCSSVTLEITERLLMETKDNSLAVLQEFINAGIKIALDDFGTGYSSISYLQRFNIDLIKIDRSFVMNLSENSENMVLCKAIINMAHQLGKKVIAEGIETQQQHDLLWNMGCDFGQGYFYSKPVNSLQFSAWMQHYQSVLH